MTSRKPTAKELRQVAQAFERLLEKVEAGELTAPPRLINEMEGAVVTLKATAAGVRH
jgi:hypothetical protein